MDFRPTSNKHLPLHVLLGLACLAHAFWWGDDRGMGDQLYVAYIGPGAGIALLGSFLAVFAAVLSALIAVLTWPMRAIWRMVRGRKAMARARVKRVVILGLDGLDPLLVEEFMEQGLLPNLASLRAEGCYARLGTTWPPLSPVAWSSFTTGTNPGKHNIFDFITRSRTTYRPTISSVDMRPARRVLRLGRFCLPLSRPTISSLRKSRPFWSVLSDVGIYSAVLRVPISFPPDKFRGVQLSAMCVPDLRGTQGTFTYFTETHGPSSDGGTDLTGQRIIVERVGNRLKCALPGPANPLRDGQPTTHLRFEVAPTKNGCAVLRILGQKIELKPHAFTKWVSLKFKLAPGVYARGLCRFYMKQCESPFELYCTPIHIDPCKPVMPISHPRVYSVYLSRLLGPYATLGLAEDTSSLSEDVLNEAAFLEQAYAIHREREGMFFDALRRVRRGMVTCVFDAPDRIQHMFWRFHDDHHPAAGNDAERKELYRHTIRDMYVDMDRLVGRTRTAAGSDSALFVMSDHGFKPFRRGVDLNAWLLNHGYLKLKNNAATSAAAYLADVDWSSTKAYAIGLAGIYVNLQGREAHGIVQSGHDAERLMQDICDELNALCDPQDGMRAIHQAVRRNEVYHGPYVDAAPDVIVGYSVGYRVSWETAIGKCGASVFSNNMKPWSGDHCLHPELVPGILFSNLPLRTDGASIVDLAPTTLDLLGVGAPPYFDGKSLLCVDASS